MGRYVVVVPLKPPGKNDLRPDPRIVWRGRTPLPAAFLRYQGLHRDWERAIREPTDQERARGPRRLRFYRYMTAREKRMDEWNLVGGLNLVVVDILVHKGWLVDDREDCVRQERPFQGRSDDEIQGYRAPMTVIVLQDVTSPPPAGVL